MKLCKDCKNYQPDTDYTDERKQAKYSICSRVIRETINPISGEIQQELSPFKYCQTHREVGFWVSLRDSLCGKRGRWWEAK